jgi:hypothetical protein
VRWLPLYFQLFCIPREIWLLQVSQSWSLGLLFTNRVYIAYAASVFANIG